MREVMRAQLSILPEEFGLWLSLVERLPRVQEAVGSNPTSPMTKFDSRRANFTLVRFL
jgi:hypothetical protein